MKNTIKWLGIIAFVAVIGFAMAGCRTSAPVQASAPAQPRYELVDGNLIIFEGVTSIGAEEFRNRQLTSVTIPNSVTSIGNNAFRNNQLTSVTIPNSVTSIGSGAFFQNLLTNVTIGNRVTSIGDLAFAGNVGDGYPTNDGNQLTSITIPNSVTSIGRSAFAFNQLTSVTIPNSVSSIGNAAFAFNQLTSVTIPNSVSSIGIQAFRNNQLTSVTIPAGVLNIGDEAFRNNQLTSVAIVSDILLTLGEGVFADNPRLVNPPLSLAEQQARLPNLYRQAGNNFGNLPNTSRIWRHPSDARIFVRYNFGSGNFLLESNFNLLGRTTTTTGTFRVSGDTVIFLSSEGEYSSATIIGNTFTKVGDIFSGGNMVFR